MVLRRRTARFCRTLVILATVVSAGAGWPSRTEAISHFGAQRESGREPAEIDFDDIWFYDEERSKRIPDIHPQWIAAAFDPDALGPPAAAFEPARKPGSLLQDRAGEIVRKYEPISEVLYDPNLAEDACFFRLREGLSRTDLKNLIRALGREGSIAYAHPVLTIGQETVAYFNAFRMKWKTTVDESSRQSLREQAHVYYEHAHDIYRVDVMAIPFFEAINLLAEDVRVQEVTPVFVPLEPTIRVRLSVPLQGCKVGDRIPFTLRIEYAERIRIDPSSLVNINLRPEGIQKELFDLKFEPYDYVKASSESPVTLEGWMRLYSPGEFVLPAVEIHYECATCSGERVRSIRTEAIPLQVASLVPAKAQKPDLVIPMDEVVPLLPTESLRERSRRLLWQAIACFLLAAALLTGWARMGPAARRARQGAGPERREDILAEKLRDHLSESPAGPHWMYAGDAGRLLRAYLVEKYGLERDAGEGSGEVFYADVRDRMPDRVASRVRPLLEEIDRMIAMETDDYPELARWKSDILACLELAQSLER